METSSDVNTVYKLQPILDNPIFEGFGCFEESLLGRKYGRGSDFGSYETHRCSDWSVTPLSEIWKTTRVEGRVRPFNDFPCLNMHVPAFSERAANVLREYLEPNGELLPLEYPEGEEAYFAYNCFTIFDALDVEKSEVVWSGDKPPGEDFVMAVDHFELHRESLRDASIFHIRHLGGQTYVTNVFVEAALKAGLNGFDFIKIWPYAKGINWVKKHKELSEAQNSVESDEGRVGIKAESLVIELELADKRISQEEKKRIKRFQDEIDAQLMVTSIDAPYFGSLEGRRTGQGRTRLILSCPDAAALLKKLRPWLCAGAWPNPMTVLMREAAYDDSDGDETIVDLNNG